MYVRDYRDLPVEPGGVEGLSVRWAINASQGANNFGMRIFELEAGKESPLHQHDNEHEIFVLAGKGEVRTAAETFSISEGSVIYIASNESHQFRNTGSDVLRFIDVVLFPLMLPR
ncbi:MAG TPA: cupin domain-containing protein [Anaerolineales bacterium]|nr:cupin domain-containing protein [Anaerolineales bacterium]